MLRTLVILATRHGKYRHVHEPQVVFDAYSRVVCNSHLQRYYLGLYASKFLCERLITGVMVSAGGLQMVPPCSAPPSMSHSPLRYCPTGAYSRTRICTSSQYPLKARQTPSPIAPPPVRVAAQLKTTRTYVSTTGWHKGWFVPRFWHKYAT